MTRGDAKTLLIADDDHELVNVLSIRCRLLGLKVFAAFDAFTALSLVRTKMPDLVCLDVGMPGGNGLSVCEMITSDPTFREIPVIMLTGRSDPKTICRCHSMCAYYVEKSTDTWERLEPLIRELLEIPSALPAEAAKESGGKTEVEPEPVPIFPSLSALYTDRVADEPIATSANSVVEPAALRVQSESMDASHPNSADSCSGAAGSLDIESKEPCSLPEWETWIADPTQDQGSSPEMPAEFPSTPTAAEAVDDIEVRERQSDPITSQEAPEPLSETEAPAEPSSMWRQLAQSMGRVVGRTPENSEESVGALVPGEEPASQTDISQSRFQHEAPSPIWRGSVTLPVESTRPVESTPALLVNDQDRRQSELSPELEQETPKDRWTAGRTSEPAPVAELDHTWSLASRVATTPRSTDISSDEVAKSVPAEAPKRKSKPKKSGTQREVTLLIADDDGDLVQMLVLRCKQLGLRVFRSPDAMHALLGAHRVEPDLVILDVNMPGGNGLSVCEMMVGDSDLARIPVIIMTGDANEEIPHRCRAMQAQFLRKGPGLWERLEPMIRESVGMPPAVTPKSTLSTRAAAPAAPAANHQPRILCIDDDPEISKILKLRLEPYGVDVLRAFKGMQGYWTALDMRPDLVILDMVMPDGGGNYILGRLRAHPLTEKIPVLMLTGINTPGVRRQMFGMGVDAYLTKPFDFDDLIEHVGQYVTLQKPIGSPVAL
jgi:DNA-binding response OmpR family regulator